MAAGQDVVGHRAAHGAKADNSMSIMSALLNLALSLLRQRRVPAETFDRVGPRLVCTSDPAAIADRVEVAEQEGIVDLAGQAARWIASLRSQ